MAKSSPYHFVRGPIPGSYSVRRNEVWLGYVTKHVTGWVPADRDRRDLPIEPTREAAARALWLAHEAQS